MIAREPDHAVDHTSWMMQTICAGLLILYLVYITSTNTTALVGALSTPASAPSKSMLISTFCPAMSQLFVQSISTPSSLSVTLDSIIYSAILFLSLVLVLICSHHGTRATSTTGVHFFVFLAILFYI